jgi:hypothetical protein
MKTRTLMLLALGCGVAIMLAGAVFLFQLTNQAEVEAPVPIGELAAVGDMSVAVNAFSERNGVLRVAIIIGGIDDDDPTDGFRLIASARPVVLASSSCPPSSVAMANCSIEFDVGDADGVSRVLFYERGDDQARWVLDRAG